MLVMQCYLAELQTVTLAEVQSVASLHDLRGLTLERKDGSLLVHLFMLRPLMVRSGVPTFSCDQRFHSDSIAHADAPHTLHSINVPEVAASKNSSRYLSCNRQGSVCGTRELEMVWVVAKAGAFRATYLPNLLSQHKPMAAFSDLNFDLHECPPVCTWTKMTEF
ncbi:hypothetical protein BR93DRAFT_924784 [Coniochaeta sp. PMI_546]|nr:hypothetical protein BR93DRAFT_924784 [Coniochaeta sp. PMI_546]